MVTPTAAPSAPLSTDSAASPSPSPLVEIGTTHRSGGQPAARLRVLDGLRFLAALSVVIFHLVAVAGRGSGTVRTVDIWGEPPQQVFGWFWVVACFGWTGVNLFFLISGFVICMSSWGRGAGRFAVSRIVRLFPAYWAAIGLTTACVLVFPAVFRRLPWKDILLNLTMQQQSFGVASVDAVYWTLVVELKFYLLFMIVIWLGLTYRTAVGFCLLWTVASAIALEAKVPLLLNAILVPTVSHYFVAGVAMYLIYRFGPNLILYAIVGYSWIVAMHYDFNLWPLTVGLPTWPAMVLISASFAVMLLLALHKLEWLRWRGLTALGATTYPLYLLHYTIGTTLVFLMVRNLDLPPYAILGIALTSLVVLSWMVHRLVERPLAPILKRHLERAVTAARRHTSAAVPAGLPIAIPKQQLPVAGIHEDRA